MISARFLHTSLAAVVLVCLTGQGAMASSLSERLDALLGAHDKVAAARESLTAATERVEEAYATYYPNLAATASVGKERRQNPNADNTTLTAREMNLTVTQRVTDFGVSESTVDLAKLRQRRAEAILDQVTEQVLLDALVAHLEIARTSQVVGFAEESVANITRQANLEDARVQRGGGFSTDVLQAETQLVGAQARLVLAQGDQDLAENRYISVYGYPPDAVPTGDEIVLSPGIIPASLDEALAIASENNPQLEVFRIDEEIGKKTVDGTKADVAYPELDIVGEQIWSDNVEGVIGTRVESIIRLQLSYEFNMGMTMLNSIRAAEADARAAGFSKADILDQVQEQVRDAWVQLTVTRQNAALLEQQAQLAERFLELAREERRAGRRSLIDVLAGETALNNARSDAASARLNEKVASLALLTTMGVLDLDAILY